MIHLGLEIYGRNWKEISKYVGTRNGAQIRSHAQKYFLKLSRVPLACEQDKTGESSCEKVTHFSDTALPFEDETHNSEFSHYFNEMYNKVYLDQSMFLQAKTFAFGTLSRQIAKIQLKKNA